jgi:hypothetical protein
MLRTLLASLTIAACLAGSLAAQITIYEDDFESYPSDFDLYLTWEPATGGGVVPPAPEVADAGILTSDEEMFPGIEGEAVAHVGGAINQWFPWPDPIDPIEGDAVLEPTEEHSIQFGGDVFIPHSNSRLSVGLRSNAPGNILELGAWNTDLGQRGFAYRLELFGSGNVNWQYFELPLEFDTNEDGTVSVGDIGPAWHRYQATITPADVTFELDIFRDGTVDAVSVVEATPHESMFDSFRIGGPSGVTSPGEGAFDNVFLRLVEPAMGGEDLPGDYSGNGLVEQADLDLVLGNWGADAANVPATWVSDPPEGFVDQAELDKVLGNWGSQAPGLATAAGVPEPGSLALALACAAGMMVLLRRRR